MEHTFESRERAMQRLLILLEAEPWLERYALLFALEASDLGLVNQVVDASETALRDLWSQRSTVLAKLLKERFG